MNFLELCQKTAQQTGTIQASADGSLKPTTVTGQINRLRLIVDYVREAYIDIQNAHRGWRWLNSEFVGELIPASTYTLYGGDPPESFEETSPAQTKYAGTDFRDERTGLPIDRFSSWGFKGDGSDIGLSIYETDDMLPFDNAGIFGPFLVGDEIWAATAGQPKANVAAIVSSGDWAAAQGHGYMRLTNMTGVFPKDVPVANPAYLFFQFAYALESSAGAGKSGEGYLRFMEWERFYETQLRGVQTPGMPQVYSLTPDQKLIVSPPPSRFYRVRGQYRKSAQYLTADADIPEMPSEFHSIIKDAALQYIEGFDEGPRIPVTRLRMLPNFSMLEAHQLPKVTWGASLA